MLRGSFHRLVRQCCWFHLVDFIHNRICVCIYSIFCHSTFGSILQPQSHKEPPVQRGEQRLVQSEAKPHWRSVCGHSYVVVFFPPSSPLCYIKHRPRLCFWTAEVTASLVRQSIPQIAVMVSTLPARKRKILHMVPALFFLRPQNI